VATFSIVTMGGLAAMTAYCWDNQPLGLGAGFKMTPVRAVCEESCMLPH
jgi:hypothetical protein